MWLMLQQPKPDDYVIATNETHSVREFLELAFDHAGLNWKKHVKIDPRYFRPAEVDLLIGDYSKAKRKLGWKPKTKFAALTRLMVDADIELLERHSRGETRMIG
jgi:GDPmannose 4,6-dehydratase